MVRVNVRRLAILALASIAAAGMLSGGVGRAPAAAQAPASFLVGIEDLPLMPELRQIVEVGVTFDTPGGRIVELYATGGTSRARVLEFYAGTLPQLGWRPAEPGTYRREGERLLVDFPDRLPQGAARRGESDRLIVRFFLSPG